MPFVAGNNVSMTLYNFLDLSGQFGPIAQAQPPKFGVVTFVDTDPNVANVLWQDGSLVEGIPEFSLDLIEAPDSGVVESLQGRILQGDPAVEAQQASPEYQGVAVAFYTRDQGANGTPSATLCLMKTEAGTYRELLASTLMAARGR